MNMSFFTFELLLFMMNFPFYQASNPTCPPPYREFNDFCYRKGDTEREWKNARDFCRNEGGDLVSILSQSEASFIADFYSNIFQEPYIGLEVVDMVYKWSDGSRYSYTLINNQIANPTIEKCVMQEKYNPISWTTSNCGMRRKFICKKSLLPRSTVSTTKGTTRKPSEFCPTGWIELSNKCFLISYNENVGYTWDRARRYCRNLFESAELASILNRKENLLISSNLINVKSTKGLWFGAFRTNNNWVWADNSVIPSIPYTNWAPNRGNGKYGYLLTFHNYATYLKEGMWGAGEIETKNGFVCSLRKNNIPEQSSNQPEKNKCKNGKFFGDGCQEMIEDNFTWQKAAERCRQKGMNLASIHSYPANAGSNFLTHGKKDLYWIGLTSVGGNKTFFWDDRSDVTYTNWESTPDNNEKCVALVSASGAWKTVDCNLQLPSICKSTLNPPRTTPVVETEGSCPDSSVSGDWLKRGSHCYYFSKTKEIATSFSEVSRICIKHGNRHTTPVSIVDDGEQSFITTELMKRQNENKISVWLGLIRSADTLNFHWRDESPLTFERWDKDEPKRGRCAQMTVDRSQRETGFWQSAQCSDDKFEIMCKTKKINSPPTPNPVSYKCPKKPHDQDEWEIFGNKCFLFGKFHMLNYDDALNDCKKVGGSLAEINSQDENLFLTIKGKIHFAFNWQRVWIGLKKVNGTLYRWLSGRDIEFHNWHQSDTRREDCVIMDNDQDGTWKTDICEERRFPYVCQTLHTKDSTNGQKPNKKGLSSGSKVGIGIGVVAVACIIIVLVGFIVQKRLASRATVPAEFRFKRSNSHASSVEMNI